MRKALRLERKRWFVDESVQVENLFELARVPILEQQTKELELFTSLAEKEMRKKRPGAEPRIATNGFVVKLVSIVGNCYPANAAHSAKNCGFSTNFSRVHVRI